jgi:hypothetical protein
VIVPLVLPVNVSPEQLAVPPPPLSAHERLVGDTPAPLVVTLNVPVGVFCPTIPLPLSVTVTVQLVA